MKADRKKVYEMYEGKCGYCGCELVKGWHIDHVEAIRRSWKWKADEQGKRIKGTDGEYLKEHYLTHPERDKPENHFPSCASCNINKHGMTVEEFRAAIAKFVQSLNNYSVQYKVAKRYGLIEETRKPVIFYFEHVATDEENWQKTKEAIELIS